MDKKMGQANLIIRRGGGGNKHYHTVYRNKQSDLKQQIIHKIRNNKTLKESELTDINSLSFEDRMDVMRCFNSMALYIRDLIDTL